MVSCDMPWAFSGPGNEVGVDSGRETKYADLMDVGAFVPMHPDRGCREAPSCLSCPLPACIYEARILPVHGLRPGWVAVLRVLLRHRTVTPIATIAKETGLSGNYIKDAVAHIRIKYGANAVLTTPRGNGCGYYLPRQVIREVLG